VSDRLVAVVATTLRVPASSIDDVSTFTSLGMDSLAAVELTAAIEDALEIELPLSAVHEYPTLEALRRFIEHGDREARGDQMIADAVLPDDIRPTALPTVGLKDARSLLLTGATGFIGAFLLRELLDATTATIHCLVRGDASRVCANLERYDCLRDGDVDRIRVVVADLTKASLGLDDGTWQSLAASIDVIIHGGAEVDWVRGYESLRATNVVGTRELLRLACGGAPKAFHFLSSTSVCHSTSGPRVVDERTDVLAGLTGLRLGYAQSKCVAEALVREAGARGLPVTIIRPSLVTGASASGKANVDDLTSRFIAGCIRMHAAPDLDWRMDCVPVDDVARATVRLAVAHDAGCQTAHIVAPKPRHWRECVLWMRTCGYDIELLPYAEWCDVLRSTSDDAHPLNGLRSFFLNAIAAERYLTLPELFEESRRSQVNAERSRRALKQVGAEIRQLDSRLLARYFENFIKHGVVPRADRLPTPSVAAELDLRDALRRASLDVRDMALSPFDADESIVAELTAWRAGTQSGLFRAHVTLDDARRVELFVKAKTADVQMIEVAESLAALASSTLGETVSRFKAELGLTHAHVRELAIYAMPDAPLRAHAPRAVFIERDDDAHRWILGLESLDPSWMRSASDISRWDDAAIDATIVGLSDIHSAWYGRDAELRGQPWLCERTADSRIAMKPLWAALAEHARERSSSWSDHRLRRIHARLVEDVASWSRALGDTPHTLIHNDFNPRNIALRPGPEGLRLCAFDWELATIGLPQRDLAELLCFVLPPDASLAAIARWIERHRTLLARATGVIVPRSSWEAGFSAALCDVLVDRFGSYAMIDRVRPQPFLPRIVRSWLNLFRHYPWAG
jgi:thioester reductase-like protein